MTDSVFTLASPTTDEIQRGEEVTLPCGLVACIVSSIATARQANEYKRAFQQVGGKKALEDATRVAGAKMLQATNLVLARYNLVYLRVPEGANLTDAGTWHLRGVSQNGQGPATVLELPAKVEAEKDKLAILEGFPEIREQVRVAVESEGESLDEIAEGLSGN